MSVDSSPLLGGVKQEALQPRVYAARKRKAVRARSPKCQAVPGLSLPQPRIMCARLILYSGRREGRREEECLGV